MKKTPVLFVVLVTGMLFSGTITGLTGSAAAESVTLTYSNFFPPSHIQSILAEAWCKEVEEKTNGDVKISYFPGSALIKASQIYDGVVSGRTDIGMSCLLYTRGRFPLMDVINLPFGNPGGKFATAVFNELNDKFQPEELSDTRVMFLHAHGLGLLHTKDKNIHTLDDLKGLKIRTPGSVAGMIKALGATPVSISMSEVYQALQKGVADGAVYPEESNKGWKFGEVIDYSIACYPTAYSVGFFVVMNKKKWEALSASSKEIITRLNSRFAIKHGEAWDESDYEGIRFSLGLGNSITGIDPDEAEKWKKAVQPVFDEYLEKTRQRKVPGDKALEFLNEKLELYKNGKFKSCYY